MKNWRFIASGAGLSVSAVNAVVVTAAGNYDFTDKLCCAVLLVTFGYLFLSHNSPQGAGAGSPWWW
jgi:hypothetical protein